MVYGALISGDLERFCIGVDGGGIRRIRQSRQKRRRDCRPAPCEIRLERARRRRVWRRGCNGALRHKFTALRHGIVIRVALLQPTPLSPHGRGRHARHRGRIEKSSDFGRAGRPTGLDRRNRPKRRHDIPAMSILQRQQICGDARTLVKRKRGLPKSRAGQV